LNLADRVRDVSALAEGSFEPDDARPPRIVPWGTLGSCTDVASLPVRFADAFGSG
jgi:hypothetical protein